MKTILGTLDRDFGNKIRLMLTQLESRGLVMRPFYGIRTPIEQAKLWRQSRTRDQIDIAIRNLDQAGAPILAACLVSVGPQRGRHVTNALPGYSWHQYGEAVDLFAVDGNGAADWDVSARGYVDMAEIARALEMKPGRDFGDAVHIQSRYHEPHQVFTIPQIEVEMVKRFPEIGSTK